MVGEAAAAHERLTLGTLETVGLVIALVLPSSHIALGGDSHRVSAMGLSPRPAHCSACLTFSAEEQEQAAGVCSLGGPALASKTSRQPNPKTTVHKNALSDGFSVVAA